MTESTTADPKALAAPGPVSVPGDDAFERIAPEPVADAADGEGGRLGADLIADLVKRLLHPPFGELQRLRA